MTEYTITIKGQTIKLTKEEYHLFVNQFKKEDIPEVEIKTTFDEYFTCPSCKTTDAYWPSRIEMVKDFGYFKCCKCGQKLIPIVKSLDTLVKIPFLETYITWLQSCITTLEEDIKIYIDNEEYDTAASIQTQKAVYKRCLERLE